MCGIVGAVAQRDVASILLEGLKRLEYRGYDSAGIAILEPNQPIQRCRTEGKVQELVNKYQEAPVSGGTGIAHTRWATHGAPCQRNAHPHMSGDDIAVVHNGIIENHHALSQTLKSKGYDIVSDTDTELSAHLFDDYLTQGLKPLQALQKLQTSLEGAFALALIRQQEPDRLFAVRNGSSPLVIGLGIGENFLASDQLALLPVTHRFIYLEEGDCADIRRDNITIIDKQGNTVEREIHTVDAVFDATDKGPYRHYMQKEIFEQPQALSDTLEGRLSQEGVISSAFGLEAERLFAKVQRVQIVACGTSYHAGMVARYWLEGLAGIPCRVEVASEFRYRDTVVEDNTLFVTISQSGETADTLAALREAKTNAYLGFLAICNVAHSSLVRESTFSLLTRAGVEIGVASTKAFTTQLSALMLLTLALGRHHRLSQEQETEIVQGLKRLPHKIDKVLKLDTEIEQLSQHFADKQHALFLGRGAQYPVALEGALKLKEISYIHAEAYPAGELKHGPLALVDANMPVVTVAPNDELLEKLKSNLQEVRARGGELFVFADKRVPMEENQGILVLAMPKVLPALAPILYTVPLQLLSYHAALLKGTDVDQPRNLAKSVTVE